MTSRLRVALLGDRSSSVPAHAAIDLCFALPGGASLEPVWISSKELRALASFPGDFAGVWCTPGSPYLDTAALLSALRLAREGGLPFLGTCGGFQHHLLERFHHLANRPDLGHEEQDPAGGEFLIHRLACSLVDAVQDVRPCPGTFYESVCGSHSRGERFRCSFGFNPSYFDQLSEVGLRPAALDEQGNVRAVEALARSPFCIATLFQPERNGGNGELHPVVDAFFDAIRGAR